MLGESRWWVFESWNNGNREKFWCVAACSVNVY